MIEDLLELQRRERDAHLAGDAAAVVSLFADDFMSIQDGVVTRPSRAESLARFERYFAAVTFLAWDDLAPPAVELSNDATLATVVVQKRVHVSFPGPDEMPAEELTLFAWVEVWRRRTDRWELVMMISTRQTVA